MVGNAYGDLARREAERTASLEGALAAAGARREALIALAAAENHLAEAVDGLVRAGMGLADAAASVQLDADTLRRVLAHAHPTKASRATLGTTPDHEREAASPPLP